MMTLIWTVLGALVVVAGIRYRRRLRAARAAAAPSIDDAAIQHIISEGRLPRDEDETLDLEAAADAEDEFWNEYWDEPDEFHS